MASLFSSLFSAIKEKLGFRARKESYVKAFDQERNKATSRPPVTSRPSARPFHRQYSLSGCSSDPLRETSPSKPQYSLRYSPIAVSNVRHQRSKSAGTDKWLDHQPRHGVVPLDTVMQPNMKRRKSVKKLEEKHVLKSNKYMLTTQNQLEGGEMETRLYKVIIIFLNTLLSTIY